MGNKWLKILIDWFIFCGIFFILFVLTSLVWQGYELLVHGELTLRNRDGAIGMLMAFLGARYVKSALYEAVGKCDS